MIKYWVYFPQGIRIIENHSTEYTKTLLARNIRHAEKLMRKYDGAYFERIIHGKNGKYCKNVFVMEKNLLGIPRDVLWDVWETTKDEIIIDKRRKQNENN